MTEPAQRNYEEDDAFLTPEPNQGLKVLLIGADSSQTRTLQWAIESAGDRVECCTANPAVWVVREFKPDVVIVDLAMVGSDPGQFCQDLHDIKEIASAKIIAQTDGRVANKEESVSCRFDLHLRRPIDLIVLTDMLSLLRAGMPRSKCREDRP